MSTTNKYPGTCRHCGNTVPARAGRLDGRVNGKIAVAHAGCGSPAPRPRFDPERVRMTDGYRTAWFSGDQAHDAFKDGWRRA